MTPEELKQMRIDFNLTQKQVAEKIDYSKSAVLIYENNQKKNPVKLIKALDKLAKKLYKSKDKK